MLRSSREKLDEMISRKNYRRVVFDMGGVSFMDSSGIGILLGRYKKLSQSGCAMEIKGAREGIDKIIKWPGFIRLQGKDRRIKKCLIINAACF